MWDDVTGTVWSHLDGSALDGELAGTRLRVLPLQTTTWAAWLDAHPETTVPAPARTAIYQRRECTDAECTGASPIGRADLTRIFRNTLPEVDRRLRESALVIGVLAGEGAAAFPIDRAPAEAPMQGPVGGVPVVILEDREGMPALAYHRALTDGRVLDFERRDGAIFDRRTGSRWNAAGLAVEGDLAGVQLAFVTSFLTEWYGWAAFHPDTTVYEGDSVAAR